MRDETDMLDAFAVIFTLVGVLILADILSYYL